jgi:hypothetical protein
MKARFLDERHRGRGITFATATPISNTMVEMYTMQRFLDPEGLKARGIEHFDAWAANFGEVVDTMEIAPDGKSLKPRSRFARFTNLPELQQMFSSFADVKTPEELNLQRPELEGGKPIIIACPMSDEQRAIQMKLVERYDRLRSQKVDKRVDNDLAITTDGRKLALDARMLDSNAPDFAGSKLNEMIANAHAIWQRTTDILGTQIVFCDLGVHPTPWGFSVYQEIIDKLTARGIPRREIADIGDADTDAKKQVLFERVRNGQVRVLLGSTEKLGLGTNVQTRLVALHHLDAPWRPDQVQQRDGRIRRRGNRNAKVSIFRYVTEGSFDAYVWQALETKAKFIGQVTSGENALRRAEDIGGEALSYAEVKAIASGNPAVLTLAQADAELQRLTVLKKNHTDEQYLARMKKNQLPDYIKTLKERLENLTADKATLAAHAGDAVTIGGHRCLRDEVQTRLRDAIDALPRQVSQARRFPLGVYRGLRFGLTLHTQFPPEVTLEGKAARQDMLPRDHHGPRAVLNALERLAGNYGAVIATVRQDLTVAEGQLRDFQGRVGVPFAHEEYLSKLMSLRDQLKAALAGLPPEEGIDPVPVAELADRINALKSAQPAAALPARNPLPPSYAARPKPPLPRRPARRALAFPATTKAVIA